MKTCPTCRRRYPDDIARCPSDGAALRSAGRQRRKTAVLLAVAAAVLFLTGLSFVALPLAVGWAASNCEAGFIGFRISGPPPGSREDAGVLDKGREILEGLIGTMTGDDDAPESERRRVALVLEFRNHNPISLTIESLGFDLAVNSQRVASGVFAPEKSMRIESGGASEIEVPLSVSPEKLLEAAWDAVIKRDLEYRLGGRVTFDTFIGRVTLPFQFQGVNPEIN